MIVPAKASFLRILPKSILQQPFELLLAFMCCLSGTTYVLGNVPAAAIDRNLPNVLIRAWGLSLMLGGFLVIFGIARTQPILQRAGYSLLAPTSIVYAILLIVYVGLPSVFSVLIIIGFASACLIRDYMVKMSTKAIRQVFKDHGGQE